MKPGGLRYRRPAGMSEALEFLAEPDAKVLAGGQSLVPLLNLRLAQPGTLVDINRLPGLDSIEVSPGEVRIGALVRHSGIESATALVRALPILSEIAAGLAYRAIRTRGTFCGSLAHADPLAEWPLVLCGLGGRVRAVSQRGEREIAVENFFQGFFATALEPDELLREAVLPLREGWVWGFSKFARKSGEFSLALALAGIERAPDGTVQQARVAVAGAGERPVRLPGLESALRGRSRESLPVDSEIAGFLEGLEPAGDLHGSREYKLALAATICRRALLRAWA
ncbi:MAG TPA: FAD binding domain-containing protein [Candidatus Dormibacteraeota bacterium]|nr:FAD binding domain-containing protein [Candidatus Dormibacteraeota bacterium]